MILSQALSIPFGGSQTLRFGPIAVGSTVHGFSFRGMNSVDITVVSLGFGSSRTGDAVDVIAQDVQVVAATTVHETDIAIRRRVRAGLEWLVFVLSSTGGVTQGSLWLDVSVKGL
jgi:hypothetical protein